MGKRALQDGKDEMNVKAQFGQRRLNRDGEDVEMGEFDDPWEDELEEEDVIDGEEYVEDDDEDEGMPCFRWKDAYLQKWRI